MSGKLRDLPRQEPCIPIASAWWGWHGPIKFCNALYSMPPWPNGQGVKLLIRRLRVRVPQGVRCILHRSISGVLCGAVALSAVVPFLLAHLSTRGRWAQLGRDMGQRTPAGGPAQTWSFMGEHGCSWLFGLVA